MNSSFWSRFWQNLKRDCFSWLYIRVPIRKTRKHVCCRREIGQPSGMLRIRSEQHEIGPGDFSSGINQISFHELTSERPDSNNIYCQQKEKGVNGNAWRGLFTEYFSRHSHIRLLLKSWMYTETSQSTRLHLGTFKSIVWTEVHFARTSLYTKKTISAELMQSTSTHPILTRTISWNKTISTVHLSYL